MEFDEKAWVDRVRQAKSSEELRALVKEIPLDFRVKIKPMATPPELESSPSTEAGRPL